MTQIAVRLSVTYAWRTSGIKGSDAARVLYLVFVTIKSDQILPHLEKNYQTTHGPQLDLIRMALALGS